MTNQILAWIISGGAAVLVSWACERWPWFLTLDSDPKFYLQLVLSCVLAVLAQIAATYIPGSVTAVLDPYVATIIGIFGVFGINQIAHKLDPNRNK